MKKIIEQLLKQDERLYIQEENEINYLKVFELLSQNEEALISLLFNNHQIKDKFFLKISQSYIFKVNEFKFFIEENKIDNSYTQYKNRIGLKSNNKFLSENNDVVLNFPFKDCVLEGGQSTSEGKDTYFQYSNTTNEYEKKETKRKEVFFNEVLASDEIDRLLDKKALVNWNRYTKNGKEKVLNIKRDENGVIKENLIIKGNNLLALNSIKDEFAGKVKLIYIDPPYNTGSDEFVYNDKFSHSSWLSFMKNRLEIARVLLKEDGIIFVQIDNSPSDFKSSPEFGYLLVLMDEIFNRNNYITTICWKKKGNASNTENSIGTITESIIMYAKNINSLDINLQDFKRQYNYFDEAHQEYYNLEQPVKTNEGAYYRPTMLYSIETKEGIFNPPVGKRWTIAQDTAIEYIKKNNYLIIEKKFYIKKYPENYKKGNKKLFNNLRVFI